MRHFKLPFIVTGIAVVLALGVGFAGTAWIHRTVKSDRERTDRVTMLGQGLAIGTCIVIFPFWILACGKVGKARREALLAKRQGKTAEP